MIKLLWMSVLWMVLISCSTKPTRINENGRDVQIVHKSGVSNCEIVGKVFAKDESGSEELAKIDLRNEAAQMDVDTLVITETIQNGKIVVIHAMGYICNQND